MQTDTIRSVVVADSGRVADAALILARLTTLSEHVTVSVDEYTTTVEIADDIPFDYWGSGTQALWRLLCAMAYTADSVSLYEVVSRLDQRNTAAACAAFTALCGSS